MALCTLEDIELYLLTTFDNDPSVSTEDGDRVEYLIDAVSAEIETICYRKFLLADYTEIHDGNGSCELFLNQYPINSITSIEYGFVLDGGDRTSIDSGYVSYDSLGSLAFNFNSLEHPQMFEVTYSAGYTEVPYDLNLIAVKEVVRQLGLTSKDTSLKSEKLGDYSYTMQSTQESKAMLAMQLANYIRNDI